MYYTTQITHTCGVRSGGNNFDCHDIFARSVRMKRCLVGSILDNYIHSQCPMPNAQAPTLCCQNPILYLQSQTPMSSSNAVQNSECSVWFVDRLPTTVRNLDSRLQIAINIHQAPVRFPEIACLSVVENLFPWFLRCHQYVSLGTRNSSRGCLRQMPQTRNT